MSKILIIGPKFFEINESISHAFRTFSSEVKVINFEENYPKNIFNFFFIGFLKKFKISIFEKIYDYFLNKKILHSFLNFNPDIVFVIKGHKIKTSTLAILRKSHLVLWLMDSIRSIIGIQDKLSYYKIVYSFDENDVKFYQERSYPIKYLPLALDPYKYYPLLRSDNKFDILLVSSMYKNRIQIIKQLITMFPHLKIKAIGPFPAFLDLFKNLDLFFGKFSRNFSIKRVSPKRSNSLFNQSKVIINLHSNLDKNCCNLRFFEILGSKSIQIVNSKIFIDQNFPDMMTTFNSYSDIPKLVNKIFCDQNIFSQFSERDYSHLLNYHTYFHRIQIVLRDYDYHKKNQ
jgi:hypothetical protein